MKKYEPFDHVPLTDAFQQAFSSIGRFVEVVEGISDSHNEMQELNSLIR